MAFRRSDLKGWTETEKVEMPGGAHFNVEVKILSDKEGVKLIDPESDLTTAKNFVTGISGYLDDKNNDITLADFYKNEVPYLPPTVIHKIATLCVDAQHTALLKN